MQTWKHTVPCHQISLFAQVHDLILVCKETIVWREFLWHLSRKWIHVSLTRVRTQQTSPPKAPAFFCLRQEPRAYLSGAAWALEAYR